jgi:hypothetical protein
MAMMLNKRDRNRMFKAIESSGFDPAEFGFDDTEGRVLITHSSGSTFEFSLRIDTLPEVEGLPIMTRESYVYEYNVVEGEHASGLSGTIDALSRLYVEEWLNEIRETVGVPDFWDELKRGRQLVAEIQQESGNSPFTDDERRQIVAQLQAIKTQAKEQFELTVEQIARVNERLDEVAEASKRMGRKDWLIYFLGTITALIIAATVTSGMGDHIFTTVIQGIAHMFIGGTEPPPLPPNVIA